MLRGRVLMEVEGNDVWIYGVNPGGVGAGGGSRQEAAAKFRVEYRKVLFDLAEGASSFAEFEAAVVDFSRDTNLPCAVAWEAAVEKVRRGEIESDRLDPHEWHNSQRCLG